MKTTQSTDSANGIDTVTQAQIIDAMTQRPALAAVQFRVENTWQGATRTRSAVASFSAAGQEHVHANTHHTASDLPGPFLGSDTAPTPAEHLLQALAACMNSTMIYACAARGIAVRSSQATITGDLDARGFLRIDDAVTRGFGAIRVRFAVDADADAATIRDLLEGSPMFGTVTTATPVALELQML
jgi:uncharacterized OsmC-like protein